MTIINIIKHEIGIYFVDQHVASDMGVHNQYRWYGVDSGQVIERFRASIDRKSWLSDGKD